MTSAQLDYPDWPIEYFEYDEFLGSWNLELVETSQLRFIASIGGVYLLWQSASESRQPGLCYVGQSMDVCARLGQHLQEQQFNKVGVIPLSGKKRRESVETMLITALDPAMNFRGKPKRKYFTRWLKRQHRKNSPIGDLAGDVRVDPDWHFENLLDGLAYLQRCGARDDCLCALWIAWFKFHGRPVPPHPGNWELLNWLRQGTDF